MAKVDEDLLFSFNLEPDGIEEAAFIWACATAQRDLRPQPLTGESKIAGIQNRLKLKGANLLLASKENAHLGFTLFAPQNKYLEIYYLAVIPNAWGSGVASQLLDATEEYAVEINCDALELWVIHDNERAISRYKNAGFVDTEQFKHDELSGQIERRMLKAIR